MSFQAAGSEKAEENTKNDIQFPSVDSTRNECIYPTLVIQNPLRSTVGLNPVTIAKLKNLVRSNI